MTNETPEHVIEAIDNALADWDMREDWEEEAMRWTPEPPPESPLFSRTLGSGVIYTAPVGTPLTDQEGWQEVGYTREGATFSGVAPVVAPTICDPEAMRRLSEAASRAVEQMRTQFQALAEQFNGPDVRGTLRRVAVFSPGFFHEPEDAADIRARALEARRNRHTGPQDASFRHRGR